jgi:N-methylhydantoinase A
MRIGVDVGGTFTDLVLAADDGTPHVFKVPSVPANPAEGVLNAVAAAAKSLGCTSTDLLKRCSLFVHGSTIATNTLLEEKGAKVGLLTTAGFRDSIETRRGMRDNPWYHRLPNPTVLAPRRLRLPVHGRLDAEGNEVAPISAEDIKSAAAIFRKENVESIAVCFLHSYRNPSHEQAAAGLLRSFGSEWVSISSDVSPFIGEFERSSTVVVNAYIAPRTVGYLRNLDAVLRRMGLSHSMLLIQNNGGAVSVEQIELKPAALLLSGPAAAGGALAYYARFVESRNLISMEIGGTSCDVLVMSNGAIEIADQIQIAGHRLSLPSVEVHSVGAGGGTIAGVDEAGLLFVGPQGAGASPGPAAYGLGGTEPTITDAHIVLGRLRPGPIAKGAVMLDAELAANAIRAKVAGPLGIDVEDAAAGMLELLEQRLLHAVQRLSTERGYDPRSFTFIAAGGAGPLHGVSVGRALNCRRVYIPRLSGAFCALGMLNANVRHDFVAGHIEELDAQSPSRMTAVYRQLETQARRALEDAGFKSAEMAFKHEVDMRYLGQQWSVRVTIDELPPTKESLTAAFEKEYKRLYGHHQPDGIIEITILRVAGLGMLPPMTEPTGNAASRAPAPDHGRRVFIDRARGWDTVPVYRGAMLVPGHALTGPLIVEEDTTTLFVGAGDELTIDRAGNFSIELSSDGRQP